MVNLQLITDVPSSSSSSPDSPEKYDVFLSFRGEDTRNNFISHLYGFLDQKKVKTFIDNEELERGDEISPALMKAIEESHASIIIFSENYASSKWCLEELSKIMECRKCKGQDVIPVFYNVDPSHVRKQNGSYEKALWKHEKDERVQKWRAALTQASNLAGFTWDSQIDRNEFELIKAIVGDVMKKLNLRYPIESKRLVGIEESYAKVESLLKIRPSEVQIIGIWGMGGMGKTTLATALYEKLSSSFESACFIENVRGKLEKMLPNALREKICSKLLKEENPSGNFDMIRLRRMKVFIVLDDVATPMQLNGIIDDGWLGSGSRVIVTTRNKHVFRDDHEIYEVKPLNDNDSLELFGANAFSAKYPKAAYEELLKDVIDYCKGLPLALKVLGVYFHGKSKGVWESDLKKLKKYPDTYIYEVLKLSYESLDQTQKDIFLDIACCFKGKSKDSVTSVFEGCGFFPDSGIPALLDMALITISSCNKIEMHDLIQEMGWEIVRQESIKYPERRSRLWNHEEVHDVLKNNKGTEDIEGIMLDMCQIQKDLSLSFDLFAKMPKLRYLEFDDNHNNNKYHIYLPNGLGSLPDELRYFYWPEYCLKSLPSTFCGEMLVELRMPDSNLEKLWDGVQNLGNLKTIDLLGSKQLVEVPDLSMAQNLDHVYLGECESLREVHPSIFSLPKLRSLYLNGCKQIESLTTDFHMTSLQTLDVSDCSSLKEFSVTSEEMWNLSLDGTAIHDLSSSIFSNSKLHSLWLGHCENLKIDWNKLFEDRVLGSLTVLSLVECKQLDASYLGHILGVVPSLTQLNLSYCCNLETLPDNLGLLSSLKSLDLSYCRKLEALSDNFGLLSSLKSLNLSRCCKLETFPDNFGLLSSLEGLYLCNCCNLEALPDNFGLLSSLMKLNLSHCSNIKALPNNFGLLPSLESLDLSNCCNLEALPDNFGLLSSLKSLRLSNCCNLEALPDNFGLLSSLKSLYLINCCNLEALPNNFGLLSSLESLLLDGSSVESLPANVKNLSKLEWLCLDDCMKLVVVPELPPSLQTFRAINCTSMELHTNFSQGLLLQQCISSVAHHSDYDHGFEFVMLPGGHVPEMFRITTETTSISIPSLPFSNLSGFLLCIILSCNPDSAFYYRALCHIYTDNKFSQGTNTWWPCKLNLISDHMIFWHHDIKYIQKVNDHYNNISFEFDILDFEKKSMKQLIKECGVLPVYAKDLELTLGGTITKDIVDLQSNAQSSIYQEPLPLTDTLMQDEKNKLIKNDSSDCFVGNDIKPVYELKNPQHMVVKPVEEYNDIVELESNRTKTSKEGDAAEKSTLGSPSGTDGSGCSLGNQLVAKGKKQLSLLFIIQALFLLIGVIITTLPGIGKNNPNIVAFSSVIVSVFSLIIAETGRRRSQASFLRFYAVVSFVAMLLLISSLAKQYSLLKAIQDFNFGETRKFGGDDFPGFQAGLLVYLLTLSVFYIFTVKAVDSLIFNMSPPKKVS